MKIGDWTYPENCYYDRNHGWLAVEGNFATQGITSYGQHLVGKIMFIEIPRLGRIVKQQEKLLSLESGKWVGRIPAMVSCKIVDVNLELEETPTLINDFPYEFGWLVKIEISDPDELTLLMRSNTPEFDEFLQEQKRKYNR